MKLDKFIIGVVIFSLFIISGSLIFSDTITTYNINTTSDSVFGSVYNTMNETYDISQDMKAQTLEGDLSEDAPWESMIKGSYSAIKLVKNSFTTVYDVSDAIADQLNIPPFILQIVMIVLTVSIIFALIYLVFNVT